MRNRKPKFRGLVKAAGGSPTRERGSKDTPKFTGGRKNALRRIQHNGRAARALGGKMTDPEGGTTTASVGANCPALPHIYGAQPC